VADTDPAVPIPASAVLSTLVRTPGDEPARWVRTHEAGRGKEPLGSGLQVLKVRIETSSGDGSAESSGALGSIGAVRDRSSGLPTRAETRILALAADQIALSLRRDQLRREATDVEIARQGDALKTALIDSVSHDLRTPLASIRATAGGLMDPAVPVTEGSTRAAARVIDEEAARLDHLVRAVLDLSRIEAGALRPDLEPHDLPDLVEAVVARTRTAAPDRTIDVSLLDGLPAVLVDPVLMDVVLANLLDNALVHAASPAPVRISAGIAPDGRAHLDVEDGGMGVPREALPHLFDRFYRVPGSGSGARKGLGIGLSIVRGLVEAMGGTVAATSSELGGLAVIVTLAVAHVPGDGSDR
jgi:two-component system sensor histidine kinase KdpD